MSCYTCTGCTATKDLNICYDSIVFGNFPNGTVNLKFTSSVDGSVWTATGTSVLTILEMDFADMPPFVHGVGYKVTSDVEWTLDGTVVDCVSLRFTIQKDVDGIAAATTQTIEPCS